MHAYMHSVRHSSQPQNRSCWSDISSALLASHPNSSASRPHPPRLSSSSITLQLPHHAGHLLLAVYPEALLLGHARQLYVLGIQLLLHDLLQRLEDQLLRLSQGERAMVFGLQFGLRAFAAGADGFGVVAVEGTGGFRVVSVRESIVNLPLDQGRGKILRAGVGSDGGNLQLRSIIIPPSD